MELSKYEKKLIWDYIFFHYHSPLNTNPDDYRKFNFIMFRAIKLNFVYTVGFGGAAYYLFMGSKNAIFKGISSPGVVGLGIVLYSSMQFYLRMTKVIYSDQALSCALYYQKEVDDYNDHYRRICGNA